MRGENDRRPHVAVKTRPMWAVRLSRGLPRYLVSLAATAGLLASCRFLLAPPIRTVHVASMSRVASADRVAEGAALLFARRYLTWQADRPEMSRASLQAFAGSGVEPGFGLELPPAGEESVAWAEVVATSEPEPALHVYVVAAQTDSDGLVYLAVRVSHTRHEVPALVGYPAFVGAPPIAPEQARGPYPEARQPGLALAVEHVLKIYLAGSAQRSGVGAEPLGSRMALESMQRPYWMRPGIVWAVVQARDRRGVGYTLGYELAVVHRRGGWRIASIQAGASA